MSAAHPDWLVGFADEVGWSRLAAPPLHAWAAAKQPLRLGEPTVAKDDPEPKALACDGLLLPLPGDVWLRFLDGRPLSTVTTQFLAWCCDETARRGKTALLLIWDNASWPMSKRGRTWIAAHHRPVKATGQGARLVVCQLPIKRPWLNPIEPRWIHTKRKIVEPTRVLTAPEIAKRVCAALDCPYHAHLSIPE